MLRLELTKRTDFSKPLEDKRKICVDDLYWVLGLYALALGIGGCCFALELLRSSNYWARLKEYKWRLLAYLISYLSYLISFLKDKRF